MEKLSLSQIDHIATLARLGISEDEREEMQRELNNILLLVASMDALNIGQVPPLANPHEDKQYLRNDSEEPVSGIVNIQEIAPRIDEEGYYLVPSVLD